MFFLIYSFLTALVPVIVTTFGYFKACKILKELQQRYAIKSSLSNKFYFLIIPLICFAPGVVSDLLLVFDKEPDEIFEYLTIVLHELWGLLTLLGFWLTRPAEKRTDSSVYVSLSGL